MPRQITVTTQNAFFQQMEALKRNREKRAKTGLFFLEGVHPMENAISGGCEFAAIAYAGGKRLSGWARDMLSRARTDAVCEMSPDLHAQLSDREEPCELIACAKMLPNPLARMKSALDLSENPLLVVFDRPQSPGNLGTVLRSADAFGASGVITCGHAADAYDPQCVRASIGAMFHMPFAAMESAQAVCEFIAGLGRPLSLVGTSCRGDTLLRRANLSQPLALLIGNETFGLSKEWKSRCNALCQIPIHGAASSLNAGCAASICLYEIARQRGGAGA